MIARSHFATPASFMATVAASIPASREFGFSL